MFEVCLPPASCYLPFNPIYFKSKNQGSSVCASLSSSAALSIGEAHGMASERQDLWGSLFKATSEAGQEELWAHSRTLPQPVVPYGKSFPLPQPQFVHLNRRSQNSLGPSVIAGAIQAVFREGRDSCSLEKPAGVGP